MTTKNVYDQHRAAFQTASAYVVLHNGECVAKVNVRHPGPNALRVNAYVHWLGEQMVRGTATGGGYDKVSAAVAAASPKIFKALSSLWELRDAAQGELCRLFLSAIGRDDGASWDRRLRDAGFLVIQAL